METKKNWKNKKNKEKKEKKWNISVEVITKKQK